MTATTLNNKLYVDVNINLLNKHKIINMITPKDKEILEKKRPKSLKPRELN